MEWLFVLGRNPALSVLEIASYFKARDVAYTVRGHGENHVHLEIRAAIEPQKIAGELGGTVKVAKVLCTGDMKDVQNALDAHDFLMELPKKFFFSVTDLSEGKSEENRDALVAYFQSRFKSERAKAMLRHPKTVSGEQKRDVSPKRASRLLGAGSFLDVVFVCDGNTLAVAQTVSSSDPRAFAARDDARPKTDPLIATSIRLARMMANMAGAREGVTVLDPFCGTGTVLQECLLLGASVVGADANGKSVSAAQKNLAWAQKKFNAKGRISVVRADAGSVDRAVKERVDAACTEPYLGPYLRKKPRKAEAHKIARELEELYARTFAALAKKLRKGARAVFVTPEIPFETGSAKVSQKVFLENGFAPVNIAKEIVPDAVPFAYKEPKNRLTRHVWVLEKR